MVVRGCAREPQWIASAPTAASHTAVAYDSGSAHPLQPGAFVAMAPEGGVTKATRWLSGALVVSPAPGAAVNPGPGLYTPSEKISSNRRNNTSGGAFLADDRHKYLGSVDPESGQVRISYSPGPLYKPSDHLAKTRAPTVSFGLKAATTVVRSGNCRRRSV